MDIEGYKNYLIFDDGRCLSKSRQKTHNSKAISSEMFLKPRERAGGYLAYTLYKEGKPTAFSIHRLVAQAYIPNPFNYKVVNHKNGNTKENNVSNLEWCSDIHNGQSFKKPKSRIGTIVTNHGVRADTFHGKVKLYGKYYYTKTHKTKEEVDEELQRLVAEYISKSH
jgi:hypothetical protein